MEPFDSFTIYCKIFGKHLYEGIFLEALIETVVPPIPTLATFQQQDF